jgi:hypothetical protein
MLQRIFLIVAILAGIGVIIVSQTKLREHIQGIISQRETNAKEREQQRGRANKAEKELATTSNTLISVSAELATTKNNLATATSNLEAANTQRDKAVQDLEKAKDAEKACRQDLAAWQALGLKPEQVKPLQENLKKAEDKIGVLSEEAKLAANKIRRLQARIDEILGPDDRIVEMPGLKGKVLVVDPKWEFVVLDVGENQGALKDGIMMIHRNSRLVGKVKISNVMPDRSVANLMPGWSLQEVHEGDQVLY